MAPSRRAPQEHGTAKRKEAHENCHLELRTRSQICILQSAIVTYRPPCSAIRRLISSNQLSTTIGWSPVVPGSPPPRMRKDCPSRDTSYIGDDWLYR